MPIEIVAEPIGHTYQALLRLAREQCPTFSLVWRSGLALGDESNRIAENLAPSLVREEGVWRWPGTELLGGDPATLRHYRLTDEALNVLLDAPGLYSWLAPDRPEDLAFYDELGDTWLGSIAHEAAAFFGPAAPSLALLQDRVPGLYVRKREGRPVRGRDA